MRPMTATAERPTAAQSQLYHVTLTMGGSAVPEDELRAGLERLADENPFMLAARFAADRAELRYWEEARCVDDAAALALRLWGEHRISAGLPVWQVLGIEVIERATYHWRAGQDLNVATLVPAGRVTPF